MKKLKLRVKKFLKERGWDKLRPSDLAKSISIEAAELLEIFQWVSVAPEEVKKNKEMLEAVKKELADVMIYAIEMAAVLDFDLEEIIELKLGSIAKKYPVSLMRLDKGERGAGYWYLKRKTDYRKRKKSVSRVR